MKYSLELVKTPNGGEPALFTRFTLAPLLMATAMEWETFRELPRD
jgi:hypothetical protein